MQEDGCKVYMDAFLHGITWIMFHGHLDCFRKPSFGGRPDTKPLGDHGTLKCFITVCLFYSIMREDPHESKFSTITFGLGSGHT